MENTNISDNTIFDDIFRTALEKIPQLIIPLINESFGTSYPMNTTIGQYRNEFYTLRGKKITDSNLKVSNACYHFEFQSISDSHIHIRMLEYDTAVGMDNLIETDKELHVYYPYSCILYLRGTSNHTSPEITIHYSDGVTVLYTPSVVYMQKYTLEEIFRKRLLLFLPFYIIKYEHDKLLLNDNPSRLQALLDEFTILIQTLYKEPLFEDHKELFCYMLDMIKRVVDYIFKDFEPVRKKLEDIIMRGKVLKLETDILIENATNEGLTRGLTKGRAEERENGIQIMISALKPYTTNEQIIKQLMQSYNLSHDQAESYIQKYSQS